MHTAFTVSQISNSNLGPGIIIGGCPLGRAPAKIPGRIGGLLDELLEKYFEKILELKVVRITYNYSTSLIDSIISFLKNGENVVLAIVKLK